MVYIKYTIFSPRLSKSNGLVNQIYEAIFISSTKSSTKYYLRCLPITPGLRSIINGIINILATIKIDTSLKCCT